MGQEVERKFLVRELPELSAGRRLRQGYLDTGSDAVEVRIRIAEDGAVLTVKSGGGLVRGEVEVPVDHASAESLWTLTEGRRITKVRHLLPLEGATAEVDVYDGSLAGLVVVEVEFASESEASAFDAPPWFGEELTGSKEWSNAALARRGRPT